MSLSLIGSQEGSPDFNRVQKISGRISDLSTDKLQGGGGGNCRREDEHADKSVHGGTDSLQHKLGKSCETS